MLPLANGGLLLTATRYYVTSTLDDPVVIRLLPDGSLDPAFGNGGIASIPGHGGYQHIGVDAAGRILVGGAREHFQGGGEWVEWAMWRLDPNGAVDSTFGRNGVLDPRRVDFGESVHDLLMLPSGGAYVLSGNDYEEPGATFVVHLFPSGRIDRGFGVNGQASLELPCVGVLATRLAAAPDGGIVAAGFGYAFGCAGSHAPFDQGLTLLELTRHGTVDPTFGRNGRVWIDRSLDGSLIAFAIDPQNRPLLDFYDQSQFGGVARLRSPWA